MKIFKIILLSLSLCFSVVPVFGAKVFQSKGKKVIINLENTKASKGDWFDVFNSKGKWSASVKVVKVKGKRAFAIRKGKGVVKKGFTLKIKRKSTRKKTAPIKDNGLKRKMAVGALVGPAMYTMTVQGASEKIELKGSSNIMFKGIFDYNVFDFMDARIGLGMVKLDAENDTCVGSCEVSITYFTLDASVKFIFNRPSVFQPWIGPHFGLYIPTSKKVTAITEDSVSMVNFFGIGFGVDFVFGDLDQLFVPIEVNYGIFPPSDEVSANTLLGMIGFGYRF